MDKIYKTNYMHLYDIIKPLLLHQNIIITGDLKSGKTTLLELLAKKLSMEGISTKKIDKNHNSYVILTYKGENLIIGEMINKRMKKVANIFDTKALDIVKKLNVSKCDRVFIDEIGFIELHEKTFVDAIISLTNKKKCILVVRKDINPIIPRIKEIPDCVIFDIDNYK